MARRTKSAAGHFSDSWDQLSNQSVEDSLTHRDVFENQQLERSKIEKVDTPFSRIMLSFFIGVLIFVLIWATWSGLAMLWANISNGFSFGGNKVSVAYYERDMINSVKFQYCILDGPDGNMTEQCYPTEAEAQENVPTWYTDLVAAKAAEDEATNDAMSESYMGYFFAVNLWKAIASLGTALVVGTMVYVKAMANLKKQNMMNDTSDINQHEGDQHIATPDEILHKFDVFPDLGMHCDVEFSSLISHVMLSNKGLKKVPVGQFAKEDIFDADGDIEYLKGEPLLDDDGNQITKMMPFIDEAMGEALFDASGVPSGKEGKAIRKRYDATAIKYNPDGSNREKVGKYATVADMLNATCHLPLYEPQRPAGVYVVDTAPVNTMVLAITRAGKGQTYIEPTIDMWLRETNPNNMLVNDPKGELLVKYFVRATTRGFQVIQFNLINALKTDIYNPLGMAAEAAREGDAPKCAMYVENIAEVFFPVTEGEDPVWANAANNAFKRTAYGLIDYYIEEERVRRAEAAANGVSEKVLETELDKMWGRVTLYNCYQLFVQLAAKEVKNPESSVHEAVKAGEFGDPQSNDFRVEEYRTASEEAKKTSFLWDGKDKAKMLELFFAATEALPANAMRTLINNANNALKAMGGAEKMLASVYGIAINAMSFFVDPTISTLTSGTPSQNTDLGGISFPRRMGVRFDPNYIKNNNLLATQAVWSAYEDENFTKPLGKDFYHEDSIERTGWARYFFKGKFPNLKSYLKLELRNASTGMLIKTFYFRFVKDYQKSLNGRYFITDPITDEKIFKNGILVELVKDGNGKFVPGHVTFRQQRLTDLDKETPRRVEQRVNAIIMHQVRYSEKPKAVFLVTPPHMTKYAKLILILLKQLVDLNFEKSYMTKSDQKPLYKTRFMIDELGNLQSEGRGIANFETMLSIGLGQSQQFTLILQTLAQLTSVYGQDVDAIVQGNAQPLDSLIATPDGWKPMGQIQVGDEVLIPSGGSAEISGVYPRGKRSVSRVVRADGAQTRACDEHLWDVVLVPKKKD